MRVAIACPYAWDDPGGVQVHVRELAEHAAAASHEVLVLAPTRTPPSQPWVSVGGPARRHPVQRSNAPIDPRPWSRRAVRARAGDVRARRGPRPPAVRALHGHVGDARVDACRWWPRSIREPTRARLYDLAAPVLRRVARRLAVRIAVSERAAALERAQIGGSFRIVPNGVDTERFADAEPAELGPGRKLLFVGRLDERKGFPVAVAAFAELAETRADLHLVVVGDGPERAALDALAHRAAGTRHDARRACPTSTCRRSRRRATSTWDRRSVASPSASCWSRRWPRGCRSWRATHPGYDEVVTDAVEGLLVPPRDPGALAGAAGRVLDDPDLAARLAAAGRARAAAFDWAVVIEQIEALLSRGAGHRRRPRYDRRRCSPPSGSSSVSSSSLLVWADLGFNRLVTLPQPRRRRVVADRRAAAPRYDLIPNLDRGRARATPRTSARRSRA